MALKDSYYEGNSGLFAQLEAAFQAGIAFVGASANETDVLILSGVNGTTLTQPAAPGLYFDFSSPSVDYRFWFFISTETAPAAGGRNLVQVAVLSGDSAIIVASKLAAAINIMVNVPFDASNQGDTVSITSNVAGPANNAPSDGTLANGSSISVTVPGITATGNYTTIQAALAANAAQGLKNFCVNIPTTYNNAILRGPSYSYGNKCGHNMNYNQCSVCSCNGQPQQPRSGMGQNLIAKAYLNGIQYALAGNQLYEFEVHANLNLSQTPDTSIDLNFTF